MNDVIFLPAERYSLSAGICADQELGGLKTGGSALVSPKAPDGEGVERSKYILESFVTPKSWLDPVSWTLLNASRNIAL